MNAKTFHTLPDLTGAHGFIFPTFQNDVLIYPLPPMLNCSGTVKGVWYQYGVFSSQLRTSHLIFTLLTLKQNGSSLTVTDVIPIHSTPRNQICGPVHTRYNFCSDFMPFGPENQFHLPSANFAFGIISTDISLLAFYPLSPIQVEHHRLNSLELDSISVHDTISVDNITLDMTLRILKFIISKSIIIHVSYK